MIMGREYCDSPSRSAWSHTFATQQVIALMKPGLVQMHLGSRLHELGMPLRVQFCCEERDQHGSRNCCTVEEKEEKNKLQEVLCAATRLGKLTAQAGKPVNCAETDAAKRAVTKPVREYMANVGTIEYEELVERLR